MYSENITKQDLNVIKKFKANQLGATVSYNGFAKHLYDEKGFGKLKGNKVIFDAREINPKIRDYVKLKWRFDFILESVPSSLDRFNSTDNFSNEKIFGSSVKIDTFYVSSTSNTIFTSKGLYPLIPNSHIGITFEQLKDLKHKTVLLVENFAPFKVFDKKMACELGIQDDLLVLYRGDSQGSVANSDLKRELGADTLIGWFDTDPAGYSMLLNYNCDKYIVPVVDEDILLKFGSKTNYDKQYRYLERTKEYFSDEAFYMMQKIEKGLTQEAAYMHCKKHIMLDMNNMD